jgi:hypothetical protein
MQAEIEVRYGRICYLDACNLLHSGKTRTPVRSASDAQRGGRRLERLRVGEQLSFQVVLAGLDRGAGVVSRRQTTLPRASETITSKAIGRPRR